MAKVLFLRFSNKQQYKEIIMYNKTIASLVATLFLAGILATLTGCNTMEGAGKDIEKGGEKIKEEAQEHK